MTERPELIKISRQYFNLLTECYDEHKGKHIELGNIKESNTVQNQSIFSKKWNTHEIRYILSKWYYLDHNFNDLNEINKKRAKGLYYRLSYLSDDDMDKLAYFYYYPNRKDFPLRKEIAKKYNIDLTSVTKMRTDIYNKLKEPKLTPKIVSED